MKKLAIVATLTVLAACSSLPDSLTAPFAHAAQGSTTTTDTVDQGSAVSPYPAERDEAKF